MVKTIEVYDSFRNHLLEVRFEKRENNDPYYVRTFRSSYGSLREFMMREEQLELNLKLPKNG